MDYHIKITLKTKSQETNTEFVFKWMKLKF